MAAPGSGADKRADPGAFVADALTQSGILDAETARDYGSLFSRFLSQQRKGAHLDWEKLTPPAADVTVDYGALDPCPEHEPLQQVRAGSGKAGSGVRWGVRQVASCCMGRGSGAIAAAEGLWMSALAARGMLVLLERLVRLERLAALHCTAAAAAARSPPAAVCC